MSIDKNVIPPLAKWKLNLISLGVVYDNPKLFNNYPNIKQYKTKYRILNPQSNNLKVYDISTDTSIIPSEIIIKNNNGESITKLRYNQKSPFKLTINKDNKIHVTNLESKEKIEIKLVKVKKYQNKRLPSQINKNKPKLSDFIDIVGQDRLSILTFDGCWNWNTGKPCHFCDLNPKRKNYFSSRPSLNTLRDYKANVETWWNSQKRDYLKGIRYSFDYLLKTEKLFPHRHLLIMSGNLPKPIHVWGIASEIIETLNSVEPISNFDNYLNICPHPNRDYLDNFKKMGVKQVQYNLEVIGEKTFNRFCPGKMSYQPFLDKLIEAVDIIGFGNVRSNFVLGLQPVDELLSGIKDLAQKGIVADYSIFQPKRATPLVNHPSPDMETIIYFTSELVKIYKKYGFKGIYCNLSSRSSIINECLCLKNIHQN